MAGVGRPSIFNQDIADQMCEQLTDGVSLRSICRADDMPAIATVYRWFRENPPFREQFELAFMNRADTHREEILEIADNATNDWMEKNDPNNAGFVVNGEHIQRSRLRIDARKWVSSKMNPKKYGEKIGIGQAEDLGPIQMKNTIDVSEMNAEQLAALKKALGG